MGISYVMFAFDITYQKSFLGGNLDILTAAALSSAVGTMAVNGCDGWFAFNRVLDSYFDGATVAMSVERHGCNWRCK
jgi:hypothetical protein